MSCHNTQHLHLHGYTAVGVQCCYVGTAVGSQFIDRIAVYGILNKLTVISDLSGIFLQSIHEKDLTILLHQRMEDFNLN